MATAAAAGSSAAPRTPIFDPMGRLLRVAGIALLGYALLYRRAEVFALIGRVVGAVPAGIIMHEDCDAAYPTVCVPSPPPYLGCGDIAEHGFKVEGNDPHLLDPDRNGLGCDG